MRTSTNALRRGLVAAFAAGGVGGAALVGLTGPASAAPDPCAASEVARTVGSVATSTGDYLDEHPQTNQALTTIARQQAGPQSVAAVKSYFDANPDVSTDIQQLQQPLVTLSARCKLPLTLPQLMGLMQAAQQGQGPSGGVAPGLGSAQGAGLPGAASTAHSPAAASSSAAASGSSHGTGSTIAGLP